jgi:Lipocalin-like domain
MRPASFPSLLLCLLFFNSCDKVEVEANSIPQGFSLAQIVGTWKVTAASSDKEYDWDGNGTKEKDVYHTWSECKKDNLYQFNSDKTGTYKLDCTTTKTGNWDLDGTITLVWIYNGAPTQYEKIIYLTSNTMKTETAAVVQGSQVFTITRTWSLQ